ncbi:carboxypeptidase-like regulatory domain-containing protein [Arundinibacter roseus]|uniref:carboxypeptidase-like regulatory domain-containing protein n=1 Tax=Arundinibacter roseus TaxID=2070510 RepID=UPI001A8EE0E6|nr:carboxypeptidase-like regulatory domain-containing protein [Arundinibacter roseus]
MDGSTRQSIPYATIYIPATKQGMYATDKGTFCMPLDERKPDSLRISAIGYTSRTIDFQLITTLDTLLLWPTPIALQEVLVKADRQKLHAKCP